MVLIKRNLRPRLNYRASGITSFNSLPKNYFLFSTSWKNLSTCPFAQTNFRQTKSIHQRNSFLWNTVTVSRFASPLAFPEDGKREWVCAAEGEKAETQGPSPDIENTSTSFGRRNVSCSSGIWFALGPPVEERQVGWRRPWNSDGGTGTDKHDFASKLTSFDSVWVAIMKS